MVNSSRMFRFSLVITLFALLAMLTMVGCDEEYTPIGEDRGLDGAWRMVSAEINATQIRSAAFLTADKGFFVGHNGVVLSTDDNGNTWQQIERKAGGTLWDIEFVGETGMIVGDNATFLRTFDGGNIWYSPIVGSGAKNLYDIDFTTDSTEFVWTVGSDGLILLSTNTGGIWSRFLPMDTIVTFIDTLINDDPEEGEDSVTYNVSVDTSMIPIGRLNSFEDLFGVSFVSIASGIVVGADGKIAYTTDTAQTWFDTSVVKPVDLGDLHDVIMLSTTIAIAVGDDGTILRTTDGGANWEAIDITPEDNLYSVEFLGANQGWVTGANGTILTTNDAGVTWTVQNSGTLYDLWDASFVSSTAGWVAGNFTFLNSSNGGTSWTKIQNYSTELATLQAVEFFDATHGWVGGYEGVILSTTNGGDSWVLSQPREDSWITDIQFVSSTEGWAVGYSGAIPYNALILYTDDAGATWNEQTNYVGVSDSLNACSSIDTSLIQDIEMINADLGYAVGGKWTIGVDGLILKTEDKGATWTALNVITDTVIKLDTCRTSDTAVIDLTTRFNGVSFVDASVGYAVGISGIIVKTTDGGDNWIWQNNYEYFVIDDTTGLATDSFLVSGGYLNYDLNDVYFIDAITGWAIGSTDSFDQNVMLTTTNGGTTWTRSDFGSGTDLQKIEFISGSNTAWIVGAFGAAFITTDAGTTWSTMSTNAGTDLLDVYPISATGAWVVGEEGLIIRTVAD